MNNYLAGTLTHNHWPLACIIDLYSVYVTFELYEVLVL